MRRPEDFVKTGQTNSVALDVNRYAVPLIVESGERGIDLGDWRSRDLLRMDLHGWLVVAHAQKNGVAEFAVLGAFGKLHLNHDARLHPDRFRASPTGSAAARNRRLEGTECSSEWL